LSEGAAVPDNLAEVMCGVEFLLQIEFLLGEPVLEFCDLVIGTALSTAMATCAATWDNRSKS
jgi:hypothetical protein